MAPQAPKPALRAARRLCRRSSAPGTVYGFGPVLRAPGHGFPLPVRTRPRPETGVCHRAGQERIREFGAHCVPQGTPAGDPPQSSGGKTAGTCAPVHRIRPWLRQRRAATANKKAPNGSFVCFLCYRIRLGTKCNASAEVKWYSVSPYSP